MIKVYGLISAALIAFGSAHQVQANVAMDLPSVQQATMLEARAAGLQWKVGDKANYKINIGGLINGTSDQFVREETETGFWVQQDLNLGVAGKQRIEILFNRNSGQVEKILANGQEQKLPDTSGVEVIEMKEDRIRVAAGEFECIYAKVKDNNNGQVQEAWINPQAVPMSGLLKSLGESQLGKVTQELTSFRFSPR